MSDENFASELGSILNYNRDEIVGGRVMTAAERLAELEADLDMGAALAMPPLLDVQMPGVTPSNRAKSPEEIMAGVIAKREAIAANAAKRYQKTTRIAIDPVTGKTVQIELTPLRLAFERVRNALERELQALPGTGDCYRLVRMVGEHLPECLPYTDDVLDQRRAAIRAILSEPESTPDNR